MTSINLPSWLVDLVPGVQYLGNPALLVERPVVIVGSRQCPGAILLAATDWADTWTRKERSTVLAGGFQTPVEAEVFRRIVRGRARVVCLPARRLPQRLKQTERRALEAGRLAYLSPFLAARPSAALAVRRNEVLAQIARATVVLHAAPGSQTLAWANQVKHDGLPLYTIDHLANAPLLNMGARPLDFLT